jgi:HSP20 family protein
MQDAMRMLNESWRSDRRNWNSLMEKGESESSALPMDAYETDSGYTIVAALPGVKADAIDIKLRDGILTIQGEIPPQNVDENAHTLLQERVYGKFVRRIRLPQPVQSGTIEANYHDGVLTLNIPKADDSQPRYIPVTHRSKERPAR